MEEDALGRQQALLGRGLRVQVRFGGTFGGRTMEGRLCRVQTLPPDHSPVNILLDDRNRLLLDRIDTEVVSVDQSKEDRRWLEFRLPPGVIALIGAV